jgi:hypothetical protein
MGRRPRRSDRRSEVWPWGLDPGLVPGSVGPAAVGHQPWYRRRKSPRLRRPRSRRRDPRIDSPAAIPREISSRSANDNWFADLLRSLGRTPPVNPTYCWIVASERPSRRPITRNDVPARSRRQISSFSATDIRPATATTPSTQLRKCCDDQLRPPAVPIGRSAAPAVCVASKAGGSRGHVSATCPQRRRECANAGATVGLAFRDALRRVSMPVSSLRWTSASVSLSRRATSTSHLGTPSARARRWLARRSVEQREPAPGSACAGRPW